MHEPHLHMMSVPLTTWPRRTTPTHRQCKTTKCTHNAAGMSHICMRCEHTQTTTLAGRADPRPPASSAPFANFANFANVRK